MLRVGKFRLVGGSASGWWWSWFATDDWLPEMFFGPGLLDWTPSGGQSYSKMEKHDKAVQDCQKAVKLDPPTLEERDGVMGYLLCCSKKSIGTERAVVAKMCL
eukprot:Skav209319  [mRNA]  locus=scaffold994:564800:565108:+ [translate_table: standard]